MPGAKLASRFLPAIVFLVLASFSGVMARAQDVTDFRSKLEKQTFFLINEYRKTNELPLLAWDDTIAKVARDHSKDMATGEVDFGHEGFKDRVSQLKTVMTGFRGAGENVLMTSDPDDAAKKAVTLWLHSPHHLENIRGDFNYSGMGVWQDKDGVIYFTQIFMKFAPATEQAEAAPSGIDTPFGMLAVPDTRARP